LSLRQRGGDRADGHKQKQVKRASKKMRFDRCANVRFHFDCALAGNPLLLFVVDAHRDEGKRLFCVRMKS
jgi:hypothetical protein